MSKLSKSEKQEVRNLIQFDENGVISNSEQLESDLIKFCNDKYVTKYKSDENYHHIRLNKYINLDGEEVCRLIPLDHEFIERTSVILYQESIKDRRERGIRTKNDSYNIEVVGSRDIGQKRQYTPYYQLNGEKVYLSFESSDDYSETSTVQFQIGNVYARDYNEREHAADEAINKIFKYYYSSDNQNEVLYQLLVNFNKFGSFTWENYEALIFLLNIELIKYKPTNNQISIINKIFAGETPDANQKKILRRALNIPKNIPKKKQ